VDKLLKQTKKFLLYKTIPRTGFNLATGRFWPAGRMFDTPGLWPNYVIKMTLKLDCFLAEVSASRDIKRILSPYSRI